MHSDKNGHAFSSRGMRNVPHKQLTHVERATLRDSQVGGLTQLRLGDPVYTNASKWVTHKHKMRTPTAAALADSALGLRSPDPGMLLSARRIVVHAYDSAT